MKLTSLLTLMLLPALDAAAQYDIDWFTLDGGGGRSSGGAYTIHGTIGQPDAGFSSGGVYTLQGGFWGVFGAVQTGDSPALRVFLSDPDVILAWPNPSSGFKLQESPSIVAPNWTDVGALPGVVGAEKQLSQPVAPGTRFYRLFKP